MQAQSTSAMRYGIVGICSLLLVMATANLALGTTYYVRMTGDDEDSGTSAESAFRTIRKAATVAAGGDIIYVGAGAYTEIVDIKDKTAAATPLRVIGDTLGTYTGDAGTVVLAPGARLNVEKSQNIQLEKLDFQGPTDELVHWHESTGAIIGCRFFDGTLPLKLDKGTVTLEDCEITRSATDGMRIFKDTVVTIRNCTVSESAESGIEINQDAVVTIEDTISRDNNMKGIRIDSLSAGATGVGQTTVRRCTFSGNSHGIRQDKPQTVYVEDSTFSGNGWGVYVRSPMTLVNCQFTDNTGGAFWMTNMSANDLTLNNVTVTGTTGFVFYAQNSTLTFDAWKLATLTMTGHPILFGLYNSNVTFDGVTINTASSIAIQASLGQLTIQNSTITSSGYGVAATQTATLIDGSAISQNSIGVYAGDCNSVILRNTTIDSNSQWGSVIDVTTAGNQATLDGCVVSNNAAGVSVANAGLGELQLIGGTQIRDNSGAGLYLSNCNLSLNNQGGTQWRTLRNGTGIMCNQGSLTLSDSLVEQATAYGLHCTAATIQVSNCQIAAPFGIYTDQCPTTTLDATRFSSTGSGTNDWGVYCTSGSLFATNCVVGAYQNGIYFNTAVTTDLARIYHTTVAKAGYYGVYLTGDDILVQNSIVTGSNGQYGLVQGGTQLVHTHNLIYGFNTTYTGTSPDSTEIVKPPRFVDEVNGDYHLGIGSPAINAGADLSALVPVDLDGNSRPSFQICEMGAFEYIQSNGSVRILTWSEKK